MAVIPVNLGQTVFVAIAAQRSRAIIGTRARWASGCRTPAGMNREVWRVLKSDDGTLVHHRGCLRRKQEPHGSSLGVLAFALQDDGWILRSAIVWHKPNPMPESVTDRPTNAYEMVFLLSEVKASPTFYACRSGYGKLPSPRRIMDGERQAGQYVAGA